MIKLLERWMMIGCLLASVPAVAQDAIQFSQYFSNQLAINPAYAGADNALSVTLVHRNQWTGVNGAPSTTTLTGHTLFKNENTGLGFSLFVDKINIHSQANFSGVYSYRIKTGRSSYLSLGLQAGMNTVRSDYSSLSGTLFDPNDPGLRFEQQSTTSFQFGTGVYYKSPTFDLGVSAPVLFSSVRYTAEDTLGTLSTMPHLFILGRYKFDLSPNILLQPGFLLKNRTGGTMSVDINLEIVMNSILMLALSYRSFESLSAILQMRILPQMKVGYAYDIPLSSIQRRYFNSHELMLNYVFKYKNYNVKSPR